jgi:hypothetical protein
MKGPRYRSAPPAARPSIVKYDKPMASKITGRTTVKVDNDSMTENHPTAPK